MADIVDSAVGAGLFKTLVAAVQAAGPVSTLNSPGPFRVFAPRDEEAGSSLQGLSPCLHLTRLYT